MTRCRPVSIAWRAVSCTGTSRPVGAFVQVLWFHRDVNDRSCHLPNIVCNVCRKSYYPVARTYMCSNSTGSFPGTKRQPACSSEKKQEVERASVNKQHVETMPRGDKLVLVGLGNPGQEFDNTRHNIGFLIASEFVSRNGGASFKFDRKMQAELATVQVSSKTVTVVRPRTFMNNSGVATRAVLDYFKLPRAALLVVADDMSMELGRLRLRAKGSAGGHNGFRSIQKHLGDEGYARLKVGVGQPRDGASGWSSHVLGRFTRNETARLQDVVWDAMDILEEWVKEDDLARVMNAFQRKKDMSGS